MLIPFNSNILYNWSHKYRHELILSLIWILSIIIVNPIGEFPLNDDWAYSLDVFHLSQEGKLILNEWPAMTLIAQIIWGALVTFLFGFSFTVLRISTLLIGLLSVLVFYQILTSSGIHKKNSFFGALLFMFTPLFYGSSFTFMTEVYFLFSVNVSMLYFFKYFKTEKTSSLFLATLFVSIATLIRQPGIAVGITFFIVMLFNKKVNFRHFLIALIPAIVSVSAYFAYTLWLKYSFDMPNFRDVSSMTEQLKNAPILFYFYRFGIVALYLGLFFLPVTIMLLPHIIKNYKWYEKAGIVVLLLIGFLSHILNEFPQGNVFYNLGLGPKLLKDAYWGENIHPLISAKVFHIIKIFALISAAILITCFCKQVLKGFNRIIKKQTQAARLLRAQFITLFVFYFGFVLINPLFFDRYLLPLIPTLIIIALPVKQFSSKKIQLAGAGLLLTFAVFSMAATHDYLSWNRARWKAADYLINEKGIEKSQIDGGFEFNAWYQTGGCNPVEKEGISWWFVSSDDYVLSFGNINGFKKINKVDFYRFLPPGTDSICILSKFGKFYEPVFAIQCGCEFRNETHRFFISDNGSVHLDGGEQQDTTIALNGKCSVKLDKKNPYGLLSKYAKLKAGDKYIVSVWRKSTEQKAGIVISAEPGNMHYQFNTVANETIDGGWEKIISEIIIPANCDGLKLGIYIWNPGDAAAWFDDLTIVKEENFKNDN